MNPNVPTPSGTPRPGLAVLLRRLAGVQESAIDAIPGERARYTSMGGVVLGTAAIATVSMAVAMYAVFAPLTNPVAIVFTIVFTMLWGLFILNLDRWLMSTLIDRDGWARFVRFLPRIILAVIFGVIIAEPLLLGVYHSAIEEQVRVDRVRKIDQGRTALLRCNPVPRPATPPPGCATDDLLSPPTDLNGLQAKLDGKITDRDRLQRTINEDARNYKERTDQAARECNGTPGPGLTNRFGVGPSCRQLRSQAADYYRDHRMAANGDALKQLEAEVGSLRAQVQTERDKDQAAINKGIEERARKIRDGQRGIGLLERFRALDELVSQNGYVYATEWALRIFFIVVDSLPVLVKLLTGRTAYDRVAAARLAREERAQQLAEDTLSYHDAVRAGVHRYQIDLDGAAERNRASVDAQWINRGTEDDLRRLVEESTDQILNEAAELGRRALSRRPPGES